MLIGTLQSKGPLKMCDTEIGGLSTIIVKNKVKYRQIQVDEEWRMPLLTEMLFACENNVEIEGLSRIDINHIISAVGGAYAPPAVHMHRPAYFSGGAYAPPRQIL